MGKFGKETKILLLAITTICVISFLLATGISFFLAKGFQQELLLHDYGVSGYQLNHTEKLLISAFTAQPNESDIARGKKCFSFHWVQQRNFDAAFAHGSELSQSNHVVSVFAVAVLVWYNLFCAISLSEPPA